MRCCCGLATRNHPSTTQGGSINVSIRKRRPAIGTPPTGARRRASRRPPAYPAAISTIHYATPPPVRLNEDTPVLRHPYVASSKSTGLATRFPLATPPPRTPAPTVRHAPSNSANRPQSLVAHGSTRGWPGFCLCQIAGHRHRRLERGAASSQQTAKRNGISNSKHRIEKRDREKCRPTTRSHRPYGTARCATPPGACHVSSCGQVTAARAAGRFMLVPSVRRRHDLPHSGFSNAHFFH